MKLYNTFFFACIIVCLCGCNGRLDRLNPTIEQRVIDYPNILTNAERDSLFQIIDEIRVSIGPHLAIVITDSLKGITIDQFANNTFEKIKLGRMAYKDGVLIVVSMKEKLIRIDTGEGIVTIISDEEAKYINTAIISPKFKEQDYFEGLLAAVQYIRGKLEADKIYLNRFSE
jgi:uncharacterized protein